MEQILKKCRCCGRELPIYNFKKGRWGVVSVCNECDKQHRAENRQAESTRRNRKLRMYVLRTDSYVLPTLHLVS